MFFSSRVFLFRKISLQESPPLTDPRPDATQTLPLSSFDPAQLRKGRSACAPCCSSRAARGADHDATSLRKSAKEVRAERKEKRKREEEEARTRGKKPKKETGVATTSERRREDAEDAVALETIKPTTTAIRSASSIDVRSNAIDFGAVERFDPDDVGEDGSDSDAAPADPTTSARLDRDGDDDDAKKAAEAQLRKRQIYLGGVPFHKTEDEIRAAFEEENLPVETVDRMTFPDSGRFRGIAILTFATREAAKGALAWNGEEWDGTFLTVKKYAPKARREDAGSGDGGGGGNPTRSFRDAVRKTEGQRLAFACNLSWDVTEETLRSALVGCEVTDVRMGVDKETGRFRGFAHVEFARDEDLERAVALDGASVLGRPMKIAYATARKAVRERDEGAKGDGGGRRGRGGRIGRVAKRS